jgi:hypothetical protein
MGLFKLHGGIFFYPLLELGIDKLLAGHLGLSYDDPLHKFVDAPWRMCDLKSLP